MYVKKIGDTRIYLRILIYLAKESRDLWINKYEIYIIENEKKMKSEKTVSKLSMKSYDKILYKMIHNTIQGLKCVVDYLNM